MPLLSAQDEAVLKQHLSGITKKVTCVLFTQTIGGAEAGAIARQVVGEVAALNDKIEVVERNFVLDTDERARYGVDKAPALVLLGDGQDTRMRMYGAPTGYEFMPLVEAVILAGTGKVDLAPKTLEHLAALTTPVHLQVFSTPT